MTVILVSISRCLIAGQWFAFCLWLQNLTYFFSWGIPIIVYDWLHRFCCWNWRLPRWSRLRAYMWIKTFSLGTLGMHLINSFFGQMNFTLKWFKSLFELISSLFNLIWCFVVSVLLCCAKSCRSWWDSALSWCSPLLIIYIKHRALEVLLLIW